jgi:diguanylate cyclase (GGDEF)-like protein/hemerythrin-like metal-binding protein/PAS domain S-box-containing protein
MHGDVHTMAVVLAISNLLQLISLFTQYRSSKADSGLGWWTLGCGAYALGFTFNYFRDAPTIGHVAIIANHAAFVSGLSLHYVGVQRFLGRKERRAPLLAFCAAVTLLIAYLTYVRENLSARVAILSLALALLSFLIAHALSNRDSTGGSASSSLLAKVFLANGIFLALRGVLLLTGGPLQGLIAPTMQNPLAYLVTLIMTTLWTFGFVTLVNERLLHRSREDKERFQLIFHTCPDAALITTLEEGIFVDSNQAFTTLTGLTRREIMGKSVLEVNLWQDPAERRRFTAALKENGACQDMDVFFLRKDGRELSCLLSAKPIRLHGAPHIITMIRDITERKRIEQALEESNRKLEALSMTDGLTGIANRRCFDQTMEREHARHARSRAPLALIFLDIDHFKLFNDRYGHLQGDHCLREVARAMAGCARRPADLPARYGGEEFACILPETELSGARQIAERIRQAIIELALPHETSPVAPVVTASLGVVSIRCSNDNTVSELMAEADELLYRAKSRGRNRVEANGTASPSEPRTSAVIAWNEGFCSGNHLLDAQHRALIEMANRLFETIVGEAGTEEVSGGMDALLVEVTEHFAAEETLLRSVAFPALERHAARHAELLQQGDELSRQLKTGAVPFGDVVRFVVYEIVMQHLLKEDAEFFGADLFSSRSSGISTAG